ncbi:hypothetical protein ABZP36_036158 [Zizania latifolia]
MGVSAATISPRSFLHLWLLLCVVAVALDTSMVKQPSSSSEQGIARVPAPVPAFAFSWQEDRAAFRAGDRAVIMIKALDLPVGDEHAGAVRRSLSFSATVNGKKGNSPYITDVATHLGGEAESWNITFVPMRAGDFFILVSEEHYGVGVSSLQFTVTAGDVHPSASLVSWMYYGVYVAGSKASVKIIPRDAFGNDVARGTDMPGNGSYFRVSASYGNGSTVEFMDFQDNGWTQDGYISIEFVPIVAGDFMVQVYGGDRTLRNSPLLLTVHSGPLDIAKSTCSWKYGTNVLQIFSKLGIFIHQKDSFGNVVREIHPFDARVVDRATNLSIPVVDLLIEVVADGTQLLSFNVVQPEHFSLTIFDPQLNQIVSNMVYMFDVFVGYCDGSNSFANGSGLAHSVAGSVSHFMVYLEDQYNIPSPVESTRLQVQILSKNGTSNANPIISSLGELDEKSSMEGAESAFYQGPAGHQNANALYHQVIEGKSTVQASQFNVSYTPQIAGEYEIWVLCGNIVLNSGNPYKMTVSAGLVNVSLSAVLMFDVKVKRSVKNKVTVLLVDSFMNPILHLESKLRFQQTSANTTIPMNASSFIVGEFIDNKDGSYTTHYVASHTGSYNICIQFEDGQLNPCPFEVHVVGDEYFSEVQNDSISVWEDESVSFDVLSNDYIAGSQAVVNLSSALHGSVLQYNQICRYTPFEGFFGNDSFSYTISDKYNNIVDGTVFISVQCRPPQFISLPHQLHAIEDIIGPKFGGFPGIKIAYSDTTENISVTLNTQFGNVFLAPIPMKLQQPSGDVLSISRGGGSGKNLIVHGTIEAINGALQFLQYIGNEDFYGNDIIMIYAINRNGIEDADVPIFVEPINDPPVIIAPKSIFLGGEESRDGYQIFDKQRDLFEFSIIEPDYQNFSGNKSHLLLVLSLEVLEGALVITLPASILATAELKFEGNNHWQPLQAYVVISHHFILRGAGIRFRGSVVDCNNAMQQLFYQGPSHDTSLFITVNDLGNYGCYPDCSMMTSTPLSTAKTVRLIKKKSMKSRTVLLLGWAIAIEILTMLCLGGVLLYFFLKCMNALKDEDKTRSLEQTPSCQNVSTFLLKLSLGNQDLLIHNFNPFHLKNC